MKKIVRQMFPALVGRYSAYKRLIRNKDSYLHTTGWMKSLGNEVPVDQDGNPIPWMNFPVVAFLKERLHKDLRLFEFGSGYSTQFYAQRVDHVTSVEHEREWFSVVEGMSPNNVDVVFCEQDVDEDYCRAITNAGAQFDVVIIDGRDRVNCVKQSIGALSSRGVIVLDDSQRTEYQEAIVYAESKGFRSLNFEGLKPNGRYSDRTTLLYRDGNCLDI